MSRLYWDVETYSDLDLTKVNAAAYAAHPSTGFNCISWALDDGEINLIPYEEANDLRSPGLQKLIAKIIFPGVKLVAHKADFEALMFLFKFGWEFPAERWIDTMAKLAYHGYPRKLDAGGQAIGTTILKDPYGVAAMKKLSSGKYTPETAPLDFANLYNYNGGDIIMTREVDQKLPDLPPDAAELWRANWDINMRGVPLDVRALANGVVYKEKIKESYNNELAAITGGAVETVGQTDKLVTWLREEQLVAMPDCKADSVTRALASNTLPPPAKRALEIRQAGGLSSLSKYDTMLMQQVNGKLYFSHDYYGAHTGRFTSGSSDNDEKSSQLHNMARSTDPTYWAEILSTAPELLLLVCDRPGVRMKEALRGVIQAPEGEEFTGTDLSQIEARATGWCAGDEKLLALFTSGEDPYCTYGRDLWGHVITKKDLIKRTASKATVLSMGFAGGIGAMQRSADSYNLDLEILAGIILPTATPYEYMEAERCYKYYRDGHPPKPLNERQGFAADILKQRYRSTFADVVAYWDALEEAFLYGGQAGPITVEVRGHGLHVLTLPSGRQLFYHGVENNGGKYSYQGRYGRHGLWKGTVMENVAQAINADISGWFMVQANKHVAPVVHHCHDEFTMQHRSSNRDIVRGRLDDLLKTKPDWAETLPLAFDVWNDRRYGK